MHDPLVCVHICCSDQDICVISEYIVWIWIHLSAFRFIEINLKTIDMHLFPKNNYCVIYVSWLYVHLVTNIGMPIRQSHINNFYLITGLSAWLCWHVTFFCKVNISVHLVLLHQCRFRAITFSPYDAFWQGSIWWTLWYNETPRL
jgi:hypothetical protein